MQPYTVLAKFYDKLTYKDCDYTSWSQYLYGVARRHNVRQVADIACGTGKMTRLLVQHGLSVIGIDASAEMLSEARNNCKALFVQQDMRRLQLTRPQDMAVCVNDGVNYLSGDELQPFFCRVAQNLNSGAPFVFDVSTPYKLTQVVGNNVFYVDEQDQTLLWSNRLGENSVLMELTLFERTGETGLYARSDERHIQFIHGEQQICAALDAAGFVLAEHTADYGQPLCEQALRWTFYATKR